MVLRKVRDAGDARACLAAMKTSGMTLRAWTNAHAVDGRSLRAWKLNLERAARSGGGQPSLIELVPVPPVVEAPGRYRILCREMTVEVDAHFDEGVLRRLLAVVASC